MVSFERCAPDDCTVASVVRNSENQFRSQVDDITGTVVDGAGTNTERSQFRRTLYY